MGTNFYWKKEHSPCSQCGRSEPEEMEYGNHIGKRSAAGLYCWECKVTLCKKGESQVHMGNSLEDGDKEWYTSCPKCGRKPEESKDWKTSAGLELGFSKYTEVSVEGVQGCSSFSWVEEPNVVFERLDSGHTVIDEYGRGYMAEEFKEILERCPILFYDSVGVDFS